MIDAATNHDHRSQAAAPSNGARSPKPEVRLLTVHLRRVIRTAPYESWEVDEEMQAAPDASLTARQNLAVMRRLLTAEIEAACSELQRTNHPEEA